MAGVKYKKDKKLAIYLCCLWDSACALGDFAL